MSEWREICNVTFVECGECVCVGILRVKRKREKNSKRLACMYSNHSFMHIITTVSKKPRSKLEKREKREKKQKNNAFKTKRKASIQIFTSTRTDVRLLFIVSFFACCYSLSI